MDACVRTSLHYAAPSRALDCVCACDGVLFEIISPYSVVCVYVPADRDYTEWAALAARPPIPYVAPSRMSLARPQPAARKAPRIHS